MSDRQRYRAFALSVLVVGAVAALVWLVERPHRGDAAGGTSNTESRHPVVFGSEAGEPPSKVARTRSPRPAGAIPAQSSIVATARRFTTAFVEYEVGRLPADVRRAIQSTATPSFAASLLDAPPRAPQGVRLPPPAEVRSVALANGPRRGQAAVAVELRSADGEISALTELLSRTGRGWRISGLG